VADKPIRTPEEVIVFGAPLIHQDDIDEVVASMKSGWLGTGPKVAHFENDFKRYAGAPFAAAVNSCTAALHLSLLASGVKEGDEVITTPMTFCATVNAIIHAGATPVMADIDYATMNISPAEIEKKISSRTRAIIPVHFAGLPCDMRAIVSIAQKNKCQIIEDCAHAIESRYYGKAMGTFGQFGCFSFYVTKNVVTGEGGMVITEDEDAAARIKVLALHGMTKDAWHRFGDEGFKHYQVVECGYKYNMMDLQAAIGIHQLERIEQNWQRRKVIWKMYNDALGQLPVGLPYSVSDEKIKHGYHLYTIQIDEEKTGVSRDKFVRLMTEQGIGVGVHYLSIPEHPFYQQSFGFNPDDTPHAKKVGRETVSLPLGPKLTERDVEDVILGVRKVLGRMRR